MESSPEKRKLPGSNRGPIYFPTLVYVLVLLAFPVLMWTTNVTTLGNYFRIPPNLLQSIECCYSPSQTSAPQLPANENSYLPNSSLNKTGSWVSVDLDSNYTSTLVWHWMAPRGELCRDYNKTTNISVVGLDGQSSLVELATDEIHEFVIISLDDDGRPQCIGGDYFEIDLSGESWKSRPPVRDNGNGTYSVSVQVHRHFVGSYNLTITLLFRNFEGLKLSPKQFVYRKELKKIPIRFYTDSNIPSLLELQRCRPVDFSKGIWSGRWTRHAQNDKCKIGKDGRYRCLDHDFPCSGPWCRGSLGSLESNGWVYSSHCSFQIYDQDQGWDCLKGKWLFFWGDSNHVDTIRNLLNFVLGLWDVKSVPRRFDQRFTNPANKSESVRITSIFNGHWNVTMNYLGLDSLADQGFRDLILSHLSEDEPPPDVMVLNSGLHDGVHMRSVREFAKAADCAVEFWDGIFRRWRTKEKRQVLPKVFYRTTIATGGYARDLAFNPSKMEVFNNIMLEKLKQKGLLVDGGVVDDFDITFPWHYDNRCNDGVHYGKAPKRKMWTDGEIGHQYFVDLMLVHVLLNAVCGRR